MSTLESSTLTESTRKDTTLEAVEVTSLMSTWISSKNISDQLSSLSTMETVILNKISIKQHLLYAFSNKQSYASTHYTLANESSTYVSTITSINCSSEDT